MPAFFQNDLARRALLLAAAIVLPIETASARSVEEQPAGPGTEISVGVASLAVPRFPGAGQERVLALPDVSITIGRVFFASRANGIGVRVYDRHGISAGLIARPDLGRRQSDINRVLPGLTPISGTAELGGFLDLAITPKLAWHSEVRKAVSGHDGAVLVTGLSWTQRLDARTFLNVAPQVRLADGRYMRAYFGIDARAAAASQLALYRPAGGLEQTGVQVAAVRRIGARLELTASADYERLVSSAARSPIVHSRHGSPDQVTGLVSLRYRFR